MVQDNWGEGPTLKEILERMHSTDHNSMKFQGIVVKADVLDIPWFEVLGGDLVAVRMMVQQPAPFLSFIDGNVQPLVLPVYVLASETDYEQSSIIGKLIRANGILDYLPVEWTGGHLSIGMWADCREVDAFSRVEDDSPTTIEELLEC